MAKACCPACDPNVLEWDDPTTGKQGEAWPFCIKKGGAGASFRARAVWKPANPYREPTLGPCPVSKAGKATVRRMREEKRGDSYSIVAERPPSLDSASLVYDGPCMSGRGRLIVRSLEPEAWTVRPVKPAKAPRARGKKAAVAVPVPVVEPVAVITQPAREIVPEILAVALEAEPVPPWVMEDPCEPVEAEVQDEPESLPVSIEQEWEVAVMEDVAPIVYRFGPRRVPAAVRPIVALHVPRVVIPNPEEIQGTPQTRFDRPPCPVHRVALDFHARGGKSGRLWFLCPREDCSLWVFPEREATAADWLSSEGVAVLA